MTLYVGQGGNDGNNGQSWANRKLTLNGAEDIPVVAGDVVYVGPGVYRETLTCDVSGGNTYSTGTVSVTKGSATVEGSGTAWVANVAADYMLHIRYYASGNDMVTDGSNNVTAAGGNFQANMEGMPIQINTKGAYIIDTVNAANDIDISDPNGLGWPAAGAGLTYSVMSGEGHYEIESITDNDTLVLKQPWQGRTLTGLAYLTFNPIIYIADVTGEHTDGVGGVVRITGSNDDQSVTRNGAIILTSRDYRTFRGFEMDSCNAFVIELSGSDYILFEDCILLPSTGDYWNFTGDICTTIRRCIVLGGGNNTQIIDYGSPPVDCGLVVENCVFISGGETAALYVFDSGTAGGGMTFRNCYSKVGGGWRTYHALLTGQTIWFVNNIFEGCATALQAAASGDIIEDYNTFFKNNADRSNVGTGTNSKTYPALLVSPILHAGTDQLKGYKFPWRFGDLSQWSQVRAIAGQDERNTDMYGIPRPATAAKNSWGPVQFSDTERETTTTRGGSDASIAFNDAGVHQMWVPVDGSEITVSVYCYREANYAGTNPQMVIKQPGQADRTTTDAAAASQWNELTDTFTPSATPPYIVVELQSSNTAAAGNYVAFFDDLTVT